MRAELGPDRRGTTGEAQRSEGTQALDEEIARRLAAIETRLLSIEERITQLWAQLAKDADHCDS